MDKELIKEMRLAIKKNQIDDVKNLIQNNEGLIDTETIWGSFLHDAATFGTYEIAKYFIECGVDIHKKDKTFERSALTNAAFKGYLDIVQLLYDNGAILDVSNFSDNPLFAAIYNGHFDIVKFLIEKGIDLHVHYPLGKLDNVNAHEYARQYGKTEIANYIKGRM